MTALSPHLAAFLRDHLPRERNVSPHTVTTYANCFSLLVRFAADRLKRRPTDLTIEDFDPELIIAFLDHAEGARGNSARTRNARLAAIRAFFRYIEYRVPACLDLALRVRSVPTKRTDSTLIDYLTRDEITAVLGAPDPRSRLGTRDRAMLHLAYAGGLRVAELLSLQMQDLPERSLATVRIMGKGRRERVLPLWRETQVALRSWLAVRPQCQAMEIFLNANGQPMTRDGFAFRLAKHVATAAKKQPSLLGKRVTPHVLRHYVPFPIMSGNRRTAADLIGNIGHRVTASENLPNIILVPELKSVRDRRVNRRVQGDSVVSREIASQSFWHRTFSA